MWENVHGHEQNKLFLQQLLLSGKKTPSLLFLGPAGVGKKMLAKEFAKAFLCLSETLPCQGCASCHAFAANGHPDFLLVEQAGQGKDIVIDQIKEMAKQAAFAPTISKYKVCLLDAADFMNPTAANSLLKLLEEPPSYWLFILIATTADKLLSTIRSRVIQLRFDALPPEEIEPALREAGALPGEAETLSRLADGSIGAGLAMQANDILNYRLQALQVFEHLPTRQPMQLIAQKVWPEKSAAQEGLILTEMMIFLLRDALFCKEQMGNAVYNVDILSRIEQCFAAWPAAQIKKMMAIAQDSYMAIAANASSKIVWEAMIVKMNIIRRGDSECRQ